MKKLICLRDVESLHSENKTDVYVEEGTIITPAARDYVKTNNMIFVERKDECKIMDKFDVSGLSKEDLYKILKMLVDKGLLDVDTKPYQCEKLKGGFKLVRGNTAKLEPLFPDTNGDKAKYVELVHAEDSPMQSGFFTVNKTSFKTTTELYETYYIIDGVLDIKVNGTKFKAKKGDVLTIPKGSDIECSSDGFVNIFYTCGDK